MQRISFDFMARKIKQIARETFAKQRNQKRELTQEEIAKAKKIAEFNKQFIPVTRWGSFLSRPVQEGDSRPVRRRLMRIAAFNAITKDYPGESRRLRRSMAFDRVRNLGKKAA